MVYKVPPNKPMTTKSQQYNGFIRNGGNAISKHACPEAKCSNPTTGHTLLWLTTHSGEILITNYQQSHKEKPETIEEISRHMKLEWVKWPKYMLSGSAAGGGGGGGVKSSHFFKFKKLILLPLGLSHPWRPQHSPPGVPLFSRHNSETGMCSTCSM
jgi:hypothetical protein